jgi:hypothetical protein
MCIELQSKASRRTLTTSRRFCPREVILTRDFEGSGRLVTWPTADLHRIANQECIVDIDCVVDYRKWIAHMLLAI